MQGDRQMKRTKKRCRHKRTHTDSHDGRIVYGVWKNGSMGFAILKRSEGGMGGVMACEILKKSEGGMGGQSAEKLLYD